MKEFDQILTKLVLEGKIIVIRNKNRLTYINAKNCVYACKYCKKLNGNKDKILPVSQNRRQA